VAGRVAELEEKSLLTNLVLKCAFEIGLLVHRAQQCLPGVAMLSGAGFYLYEGEGNSLHAYFGARSDQ
jgi:hypothetical protein